LYYNYVNCFTVVYLSCMQCARTFLNLMANISRDQTVQYIVTMIDDILQVVFHCCTHSIFCSNSMFFIYFLLPIHWAIWRDKQQK